MDLVSFVTISATKDVPSNSLFSLSTISVVSLMFESSAFIVTTLLIIQSPFLFCFSLFSLFCDIITLEGGVILPKLIKPGTDNQTPGKYREVGPRGGEVSKPRTVKIDKGDRLPPTQEKGRKWKKI